MNRGNKKYSKNKYKKRRNVKKNTDMVVSIPKPIRQAVWNMSKSAAMAVATRFICNKYVDWNLNTELGTANTTGAFKNMLTISQGDQTGQREGKSIHVKSIYLRFAIENASASTNSLNRIIVVRQKGSLDATSVATFTAHLFETGAGYAPTDVYSPIDHNYFEILYDKHFRTVLTTESVYNLVETTIQLGGLRTTYDENTSSPLNGIFIFAVGTLASGSTPPTIKGFARVLFTDG